MKNFFLFCCVAPLALAQSSNPTSTSQPTTQPTTQLATQPALPPESTPPPEAKIFSRKSQKLFVLSGATGALSLALGASAFGSARRARDLKESQSPEEAEIQRHQQKAIIRASFTGAFLVTAATSLTVALLTPKENAQIVLSSQGLSLQISF